MPSTKIVATLGPSTDQPPYLRRMFDSGVDVFRLNTSHGTWEEHLGRIAAARAMAAELSVHVGILLDLQGPKIRLGRFEGGHCDLESGAIFTITTQPVEGTPSLASTGYTHFAKDVKPGDPVLLADGSVELKVLSTDAVSVRCEVITGGVLSDHKGINLPGVELSTPSLTRKDMEDLHRGLDAGVDFVALSFVPKAQRPASPQTLPGRARRAGSGDRQNRKARRLEKSRSDSRRKRRRDGGARRPWRRNGARKSTLHSEAHH